MKKWMFSLLLGLALFLGIGGVALLLGVQRELRQEAHSWEGERSSQGEYILETFRRDDGETARASFRVLSTEGETVVYTCPEAWRTLDLKGIGWSGEGYDILVSSGDVGNAIYARGADGWHRAGEVVLEPSQAPEPRESPEGGLPFADPAVSRQLREKLGTDGLAEEERPLLEGVKTLKLENGYGEEEISTLEDLFRYCPRLKGLELNLYGERPMREEDWRELGKLSLESLYLYMGEGYESLNLPEGLKSLALEVSPDDGDPLPLEELLLAPVEKPGELLTGELIQYVRLRAGGWAVELLCTDFWNEETEENFWGGWECKVLVSRETSGGLRHIQTLDILERPTADAGGSLVLTDVDFDGRPDLLVCLGHFGAQGLVRYECFLQREDGFVLQESFHDIPNPSVDAENQMILSQMRHSAVSHGWGKYAYRDGAFVQVAYLTEESIPGSSQESEDGSLVWQWTEETLRKGEMVRTGYWRSDEYTPEELDDIIYNENSGWGLMTDRWRTIYNGGRMADFSIYGE